MKRGWPISLPRLCTVFFMKVVELLVLLIIVCTFVASDPGFIYDGFKDAVNLSFVGVADISPGGLLRLTNETKNQVGHAFYSHQLQFKNNLSSSAADGSTTNSVSFSTTFVFGIVSDTDISSQGLAFVIAPQKGLPGLFNASNHGKSTNHVVAVEMDTIYNLQYDKIKGEHVGININGLDSVQSAHPGYFTNSGYKNISLTGTPVQVWIEYDGVLKQLNVTIAPIKLSKPDVPLLSLSKELSTIFLDSMYVGFSASTQSATTFHYILGWSFKINGEAQALNISSLPELPEFPKMMRSKMLKIVLSIIVPIFVLSMVIGICLIVRKRKFAELVEDWELIYGTHRFSYKHLYKATNGFGEKEVIGRGAFGKVYRGVLPTSNTVAAIKKVSHDSTHGLQQFISEIISIGKLRHRNLVHLLGYCRRKGELLLVYDFMPNGSLDKFLFGQANSSTPMLVWSQRFQIIKGVASGLLYLHEEWDQVVIHRDIKAANVLLDDKMNARLGDFGLAMLFDHGTMDAPTSKVVGTPGYIAPEMTRIGMASTSTDVYAFGVFLLEVACGRRPFERKASESGESGQHLFFLVDWVLTCQRNDAILQTTDPNLGSEYVVEEMELVLNLGLLCAHTDPEFRPTMRQVMQYLNGDVALLQPDLQALETSTFVLQAFTCVDRPEDLYPYFAASTAAGSSSAPNGSLPSGSS